MPTCQTKENTVSVDNLIRVFNYIVDHPTEYAAEDYKDEKNFIGIAKKLSGLQHATYETALTDLIRFLDVTNAEFDFLRSCHADLYDVRNFILAKQQGVKFYRLSGHDINGYDINGFDKCGLDRQRFDRQGFDLDGFDRNGFDKNGFDEDDFDIEGFNVHGFDKDEVNRQRYHRNGHKVGGGFLDKLPDNITHITFVTDYGTHCGHRCEHIYVNGVKTTAVYQEMRARSFAAEFIGKIIKIERIELNVPRDVDWPATLEELRKYTLVD